MLLSCFQSVRTICDEFSAAGVPNYPTGIPFIFWEQYIWLGEHLLIAVAIVLSASFVVMAVILCNFWAAMLIVSVSLNNTIRPSMYNHCAMYNDVHFNSFQGSFKPSTFKEKFGRISQFCFCCVKILFCHSQAFC